MKSFDREFRDISLALGMLAVLSGCAAGGGARAASELALTPGVNGPSADYPVLIGPPYESNGVSYTPADVWNYDEVGDAVLDIDGKSTVSGAHHTLPVPSYVEVTSLDTGRTILLRIEQRGPIGSNALISLSAGAAAQIGATGQIPVRVRRVNPPEQERALLRSGERVPNRMDTPMSLVEVLKRKLPEEQRSNQPPAGPALVPVEKPIEKAAPAQEAPKIEIATPPSSKLPIAAAPDSRPASKAANAARPGTFAVQVAAFSTRDRADRAAASLGGTVVKSGTFHRVRTGPFATKKEAEASLAKVKAAGYSDARIYSGN